MGILGRPYSACSRHYVSSLPGSVEAGMSGNSEGAHAAGARRVSRTGQWANAPSQQATCSSRPMLSTHSRDSGARQEEGFTAVAHLMPGQPGSSLWGRLAPCGLSSSIPGPHPLGAGSHNKQKCPLGAKLTHGWLRASANRGMMGSRML